MNKVRVFSKPFKVLEPKFIIFYRFLLTCNNYTEQMNMSMYMILLEEKIRRIKNIGNIM